MPDHELPEAIVVCDFDTFLIRFTERDETVELKLADLPKHVRTFAFLIDEKTRFLAEEMPVNRQAAESMARVHNQLETSGYTGHDLEMLLVRLVFCMFADDALIFEKGTFKRLIDQRTRDDGSDLGPWLMQLFQTLNTPEDQRQTLLDDDLKAFPYINGGLFEGQIRMPSFNAEMRHAISSAAFLDWSDVSPAIFGSMFQGVMDEDQRRNLGAHHTSERNILRLIQPLFLDDLYAEFERVRHNKTSLRKFHDNLATLNFLDPACGSGNFLVITYRELRRLEHKVVQELLKGQQVLDVRQMLRVNVDQMHGIDIEEFPALIVQTALWLTDHQMNLEASRLLGQHYVRLPLTASANVVHANALTTDWAEIVPPEKLSYILGNPPFLGQSFQTKDQKQEVATVFGGITRTGVLDFVSAWYVKSAELMDRNPRVKAALVSTNSVTQGEQVSVLWRYLVERGVSIHFAHRTFRWTNDARGVAAVHCVIVGFGLSEAKIKRLFEYPDIKGDPIEITARNINPYLVDAPDVLIASKPNPLSNIPPMSWGNKPVDGGHLVLSDKEKSDLIAREPQAEKYIRRYVGGRELVQDRSRWCIWLYDVDPAGLRRMPGLLERIENVRRMRLESKKAQTRNAASTPSRFMEVRQPHAHYLALPEVSSERRAYIPMAIMPPTTICSNTIQFIAGASEYHFGILTSTMHMDWMRAVCGRLKSDYRYSSDIVYNNFPWPCDVTDEQKAEIERLAQAVLDARNLYPDSTLADLYDPLTMPPELTKAHHALDRAVDRLYRKKPFESDKERLELLFKRYQELTEAKR